MSTADIEDLSNWQHALFILGPPGIVSGASSFLISVWLPGKYDANLLQLLDVWLVPCSLLISAALVAITVVSNWQMDGEQAQRRYQIIISSFMLSVIAVLGFASMGLYAAIVPDPGVPEGSALLSTDWVQGIGMTATILMATSLGGLIILIFRIVRLTLYHTGDIKDDKSIQEPKT